MLLPYHTTFRPISSGAMVPLREKNSVTIEYSVNITKKLYKAGELMLAVKKVHSDGVKLFFLLVLTLHLHKKDWVPLPLLV